MLRLTSFAVSHEESRYVLNGVLLEIENDIIDEALASARTRDDQDLRKTKYETFLEEWRQIAPAYALYRPGYSYVQRSNVSGFTPSDINTPEQRFYEVHRWRVNTDQGIRPY